MMTIERHYPKDEASLLRLMATMVEPDDSLVVQAGHFLLINDESTGQIYPCIVGDNRAPEGNAILNHFGHFPLLTWSLALRVLSKVEASSKHLMVVVNDWQYLKGNSDRSSFYKQNQGHLPECFEREYASHKAEISLFKPPPIKNGVSTTPFFGEMNLRNRYQRHLDKMVRRNELPSRAIIRETESGVACDLPDMGGELREIYCSGKTGDCAAEIAEMLHHASSVTGAKSFINFYPLVCQDFVELGTSRAVELFKSPLRSVLNVGLVSSGPEIQKNLLQGCEATLHHFQ
jgi:hypothetical protein